MEVFRALNVYAVLSIAYNYRLSNLTFELGTQFFLRPGTICCLSEMRHFVAFGGRNTFMKCT